MLIDGLIENTLKNTRLKRVRIKVDPSQLATYGYEHVTSFEGYILHENHETAQIYFLNLPDQFDSIQTVSKSHITPAVTDTINPSYDNLKKKILLQLEKEGIKSEAPGYQKILKSNNGEFLESYLKELGYTDDSKLKDFFKKITLGVSEATIEDIVNNPWFKALHKVTRGVTNIPKYVAGKGAILGKIGKFIRSLNPRDLIDVDRKYGVPKDSVKSGDAIYITNLPFKNLKTFKKGAFTYQLQGTATGSIFEDRRKINKIIDLEPVEVDRELDFALDFSPLGNKEKIGTLVMDFRALKEPTRYYKVKVQNFGKVKLITVLNRLNDAEGQIGNQIVQDEVRTTVKAALEEFFGENPTEDMGDLINSISNEILSSKGSKDAALQKLDNLLQKILSTPETEKPSNLKFLLLKGLKEIGLHK